MRRCVACDPPRRALCIVTSVTGGFVRWRRSDWAPDQELRLITPMPIPDHDGTGASGGRPPLFDSVAQARAWLDYAKQNGFGADVVDQLKRIYAAAFGGPLAKDIAPLFEYWGELPKTPQPLPKLDAQVVALLDAYRAPAPPPPLPDIAPPPVATPVAAWPSAPDVGAAKTPAPGPPQSEVPPSRGCACTTVPPGAPAAWWWWSAVMVLALRRTALRRSPQRSELEAQSWVVDPSGLADGPS